MDSIRRALNTTEKGERKKRKGGNAGASDGIKPAKLLRRQCQIRCGKRICDLVFGHAADDRRTFDWIARQIRQDHGGRAYAGTVAVFLHLEPAQAVVYSATRKGVRIPEEIQVFGFDDTSHAVLTTPKLSTVRQDPEQLADEAFDMLMAMLQGEAYPRHVQLEQKIVLRESGNILKDHLERERLPYCIQMEAEEPALFRPEM